GGRTRAGWGGGGGKWGAGAAGSAAGATAAGGPRASTADRWSGASARGGAGRGTAGSTASAGRWKRAKQTTPQAGGGSAPGESVIIDVTALLELAAWCRQRRDARTGGAACPTPPDTLHPPAPEADRTAAGQP